MAGWGGLVLEGLCLWFLSPQSLGLLSPRWDPAAAGSPGEEVEVGEYLSPVCSTPSKQPRRGMARALGTLRITWEAKGSAGGSTARDFRSRHKAAEALVCTQ